ncbi:MAG: transglutaminase-like cysteine peptidase [Hyphomicrobiales bacterium]|nr:transglutaminase-like cysteine peptidase [Hyphomicrobiales bacterium]
MTMLTIKTSWVVSALGVIILSGNTAMAANSAISHMRTMGRTSQPIGHFEYCKSYVRDCSIKSAFITPMKLTRNRWSEMVAINSHSNQSVGPVTDLEFYQREEFWAYPKNYGDCEDYVLLKRKLLMDKGWPASSLLITVVTLPNGDGHAVLTVRTDRADYALDNLNNKILPWNNTEYRYLKRQSSRHSGRWESIDDSRRSIVGSLER